MSRAVAPSTIAEVAAAALALLFAVVTDDIALVALAAPLALGAVLGLSGLGVRPADVAVSVTPRSVIGHSPFEIEITASAAAPQRCTIELALPPGTVADGPSCLSTWLRPGVVERWKVQVTCSRPGRWRLGELRVRSEGAAPGRAAVARRVAGVEVEARPDPVRARELVRSERVRAQAGDRVGRLPAEGIEFAEVREQAAGAIERRINWRASARRGTTCVNLQHPERNTDVVLLADTFSAAALPTVVGISVNLAEAYFARHDRVGLVTFGGVLDWVEPGSGPAHAERVVRTLLSSESYFSYAWKNARLIPRRLLPPGCLVVAISSLTDERFVRMIAELRARSLELAVVEIAPEWPAGGSVVGDSVVGDLVAGGSAGGASVPGDSVPGDSLAGELATRILRMEREELRERFWAMGAALATVSPSDGADVAFARLAAVRRALRHRAPA